MPPTSEHFFNGTGRRKNAVARVRLIPGDGVLVINGKSPSEYFGRRDLETIVTQPLRVTDTIGRFVELAEQGGELGRVGFFQVGRRELGGQRQFFTRTRSLQESKHEATRIETDRAQFSGHARPHGPAQRRYRRFARLPQRHRRARDCSRDEHHSGQDLRR